MDVARRHGVPARCVWLDTPLEQAQVNLVLRLLDRFGHLPMPQELAAAARREPGLLTPSSQLRTRRQLEPPTDDEGFAAIARVAFTRRPDRDASRPVVFVAASALRSPGWRRAVAEADPSAPHLLFDWRPDAVELLDVSPDPVLHPDLGELAGQLQAEVGGPVEVSVCPHPGGPPRCWCRPPLPGLPLSFARRHIAALADSVLIGTTSTHHTMATTLGARHRRLS